MYMLQMGLQYFRQNLCLQMVDIHFRWFWEQLLIDDNILWAVGHFIVNDDTFSMIESEFAQQKLVPVLRQILVYHLIWTFREDSLDAVLPNVAEFVLIVRKILFVLLFYANSYRGELAYMLICYIVITVIYTVWK